MSQSTKIDATGVTNGPGGARLSLGLRNPKMASDLKSDLLSV